MTGLHGCLNGPTHTVGWELAVANYSNMFSTENLMKLFLGTLVNGMIINHMQLCAAFVNFILEDTSHPLRGAIHQSNFYCAAIHHFKVDKHGAID
jgi:hypothetical protein